LFILLLFNIILSAHISLYLSSLCSHLCPISIKQPTSPPPPPGNCMDPTGTG